MAFAVESIPDDTNLFRTIHHNHLLPEGKISSAAFKQERMSVNWEKYSDAKSSADENSAAVVALIAGDCKALGQTVEHAPIESDQPFGPNQAHTEVCGSKKGAISGQLRDIAEAVWFRPS
jgi:hypothetical protein